MKKYRILKLILAVLISCQACAQPVFNRYYGVSETVRGIQDMIKTYDDGLLTLFNTNTIGYLLKLNNQGDTLWMRNIGGRSDYMSIAETDDHHIMVSGIDLIKLDEFGNEVWSKQFLGPIDSTPQSNFSSVTKVGNGSALFTSERYQYWNFGSWAYENALSVYNLDDNGDTLWTKHLYDPAFFQFSGIPVSVTAKKILEDAYGNLYAYAVLSESSDMQNIFWKMDATGNTIWIKKSSSGSGLYNDGIIKSNGNLVFVGNPGLSGASALEMDTNGNVIWSKLITAVNSGQGAGITELHNGNLAISVQPLPGGSVTYQAGLYICNDTLDVLSTTLHGGENTSGFGKVIQNDDLGIVNVISTQAFSFTTELNFCKLDTLGGTVGCHEQYPNPSVIDIAINFTDFPLNDTIGGSSIPVSNSPIHESVVEYYRNFDLVGNVTSADCFEELGGVDISVNGTAPYSFNWSNGTSAEDLLAYTGIYQVTAIDANGCIISDTFEIDEPLELETAAVTSNVSCFGLGDGEIDLTVIGGTPGYQFNWTNGATVEDLNGLSGGFYQVEVSDANGCIDYLSVSVTEPPQLTAVILGYEDVTCNGNCDGRLNGFATGGRPPYVYEWNDPMLQVTDTASGLCPGTYLFRVTDDNGCINFVNGFIAEPDVLVASVNTTPTTCGDSIGTASADAMGGTTPYFYSWNSAPFASQDSTFGLGNGLGELQVSDINGCLFNTSFAIGSYTQPVDICAITVDSTEKNLVIWEKPADSSLSGIKIYRNVGGAYSLVGFQPYDSISQYVDNDFGVNPNMTSYRYKISAMDTCGNESDLSAYHETIHVTASLGVGGEVNLIWDDYEGFTFGQYEIWRDSTGNGDWETIGSVPSTNFTYTDFHVPSSASIKYAIDVVLPQPCIAEKAISHNNVRSNRGSIQGPIGLANYQRAGVRLFPNPANNQITIALSNASSHSMVEAFDVGGRKVMEKKLEGVMNTISLTTLKPGVYFFRLSGKAGQVDHRIIKY